MKKLFFMHMPKTGGTSLEAYLRDQYAVESIFPKFNYLNFGLTDLSCIKYYNLVMGHFDIRVLNYLPEDCIKATIFREPVSLTISALKHAMLDSNFCPTGLNLEGKSLQQIIRDEGILLQFCNLQTGYLSSLPYFKNYPDVLAEEFVFNGIVLDFDRALSNLKKFDFVGIFEEYDESLNYLADLCGLYQPKVKPRLNLSLSDTDKFITAEDLEIVKNCNALDIKLYQEACALFKEYQSLIKTSSTEINIKSFALETDRNYISYNPFYGYGFHGLEVTGQDCYRWTGPMTNSGVTFDGAKIAKCEFLVKYCFISNCSSTLDFYINGLMIEADISEVLGLYTAKIVYKKSGSYHGPIVLEFKSDVVVDTEKDKRMRGLIISNISINSFEVL